MGYITIEDYGRFFKSDKLAQAFEDDKLTPDQIRSSIEKSAITTVKDSLWKYDIESIFTITGDDRHSNVVDWVMNLAIYKLYMRLPDDFVPESVIKNYNDTRSDLQKISDGHKNVNLPTLGKLRKFKWGSQPPRSH